MYFVVTLALKILIYALVNCGFSGFASLKLHLFIQPLGIEEVANRVLVISLYQLIALLLEDNTQAKLHMPARGDIIDCVVGTCKLIDRAEVVALGA